MKLSGEFFRFAVVGAVGFIVDASVLQILVSWFDSNLLIARIFSYLTAATATWSLHRVYTFRDQLAAPESRLASLRALIEQWFRFVLTNGFGASLNYAIYAACILSSDACSTYPVAGVALGSLVALAFNFVISKRFVFKANSRP